MPGRAVVIARIRYAEFANRLESAKTEEGRENLRYEIGMWFSHLKETMRDYRLSKETLASYDLSWNDCKRMAYGE